MSEASEFLKKWVRKNITPTTAHILGGAVIGKNAQHGVVNARHEVFGYRNLLVCDGAAVPANPGVNPSLTITAMAEAAMSEIPSRVVASVASTVTARPIPAVA